jgi:hypothetical protein
MDTKELLSIVNKHEDLKQHNVSIIPADQWYVLKPNHAFVSNTRESTHPGEHWVSVMVDEKNNAYFFCSYGGKPGDYWEEWGTFLTHHYASVTHSNLKIQSDSSYVCGLHALVAILSFYNNVPLRKVYADCEFSLNDLSVLYAFNAELKSINKKPCKLVDSICEQECKASKHWMVEL